MELRDRIEGLYFLSTPLLLRIPEEEDWDDKAWQKDVCDTLVSLLTET